MCVCVCVCVCVYICIHLCVCVHVFGILLISSSPCQPYLCKMDNQPPPQQAVAVVMDNCGCSYSGITNTFTSGGKLVDVPNQIPSVIQHCSFVVCGRRWWVWGGGDDEYGEEMMLWGGDDGMGRR